EIVVEPPHLPELVVASSGADVAQDLEIGDRATILERDVGLGDLLGAVGTKQRDIVPTAGERQRQRVDALAAVDQEHAEAGGIRELIIGIGAVSDEIVALIGEKRVRAGAAENDVVAAATVDIVVARAGEDRVGSDRAGDDEIFDAEVHDLIQD